MSDLDYNAAASRSRQQRLLAEMQKQQLDAGGLPLIVAERAVPLSFVVDDFVGRGIEDRLLRRDEREMAVGPQRSGGRHGPGIARAGEPLDVLDGLDNDEIETQRLHFGQQSLLAAAAGGGIIIEIAHSFTNLSQQALAR